MVWQMVAPYISGYDCWSQVCPSASCISNNQTSNTNHLFPSNLYLFKIFLGFPFTILSNLLDETFVCHIQHCCFLQTKNFIVCLQQQECKNLVILICMKYIHFVATHYWHFLWGQLPPVHSIHCATHSSALNLFGGDSNGVEILHICGQMIRGDEEQIEILHKMGIDLPRLYE